MGKSDVLATAVTLAALGGITIGGIAPSASGQAETPPAGVVKTVPGSTLFRQYCASCHGDSGKGDGAVAPHLRVPPTDLTKFTQQNKGTFPADRLAGVIDGRNVARTHGRSDMPVWGDAFMKSSEGGDEETVKVRIRELVKYIESIQERPPSGGASHDTRPIG
jgi:mono/diheme cytochrome c family protein